MQFNHNQIDFDPNVGFDNMGKSGGIPIPISPQCSYSSSFYYDLAEPARKKFFL